MRMFDLFCGIGGFRHGLEPLGFKCVASCEINRYARKIYAGHYEEPEYADIGQVDATALPDFDILCAGFPCQAFSIAGRRRGFDDDSGNLFFEIARIAKEKRPQTLLLENVKGLLNHDGGRTFGTILNTLYELGYDVEWQVINGKYFVPQSRERVFIVGHLGGKPCRQVFPLGEGGDINDGAQPQAQREGKRVRLPYNRTIDSNYWKRGDLRTMITESGLIHSRGFETRKDGVSHCVKGGTGGYSKNFLLQNQRIRALTPLECERLMGFPDGWTKGISNTHRYRCLGNAVIPAVVKMIGEKIIEPSF
jgi:DNA (cytosine-5)-methyltransferase 1